MNSLSRRRFLTAASLSAAGLATACTTPGPRVAGLPAVPRPQPGPEPEDTSNYALMYGPLADNGFLIPAVPWEKVPERFLRRQVANTTGEGPNTLVVETGQHFIYYTMPFGRAMRYGVGLGREGFEWSGEGVIESKQEWPKWFPPNEMIDRQPELEKYRASYDRKTDTWLGGMEGGLQNPLGARAHYIYSDGKDTGYRVHGSPEWNSIGRSVSSGCVRMMNQDVIDLYRRTSVGMKIVVR